MPSLSDTITRLSALNRRSNGFQLAGAQDRLTDFSGFGSNPGALRARVHIPDILPEGAPLVVVLHGCTQTAAGYDHGSGWSRLADRDGFALLFPEQQRQNNANLCFNWFVPGDIRRDAGEALSIIQMIDSLVAQHGLDPRRVFITGLSAGGAMAAVMLAAYPEKFAAGAIIAGLPYGSAASIPEAFDRMRGHGLPSADELQTALSNAAPRSRSTPRLSVWHGDADRTVDAVNADAIVAQWSRALDVADAGTTEMIGRHRRQVWRNREGVEVLESIKLAGMGHGTPIDPRVDGSSAAPYMLDVGLSSTLRIAQFWGISDGRDIAPNKETEPATAAPPRPRQPGPAFAQPKATTPKSGVAKTIEDALRAAGLMR